MKSYYAVIFTTKQTADVEGYSEMAQSMEELARKQLGFVDLEHARDELGITISYWESLEAIANWKSNLDHLAAQEQGKQKWYEWYKVRICKVEREYDFAKS
jgi:heme-degrading monooxygenase HmoA